MIHYKHLNSDLAPMHSPSLHSKKPSNSLSFYRRAHDFAMKAGWPKDVPFSGDGVSWQIAPDDSTMSAKICVKDNIVSAVLTMRYMDREVTMVQLNYDGSNVNSEGLLFRKDVELAFDCYHAHLQNMLHGPIHMREAA